MRFAVGADVEVTLKNDGFENSYYAAKVIGVSPGNVKVRYADLTDENGECLVEDVECKYVRPYPEDEVMRGPADMKPGQIVDVWYKDGWWKGTCIGGDANTCRVFCDYMPPGEQHFNSTQKHVRIHQDVVCVGSEWVWRYMIA